MHLSCSRASSLSFHFHDMLRGFFSQYDRSFVGDELLCLSQDTGTSLQELSCHWAAHSPSCRSTNLAKDLLEEGNFCAIPFPRVLILASLLMVGILHHVLQPEVPLKTSLSPHRCQSCTELFRAGKNAFGDVTVALSVFRILFRCNMRDFHF